mmetsp:Transcript_77173/g.174570  ORF Transcript_77173/g.174570 Transcript_77173/m.174570 type:complete len:89 (+) Transcript_77173:183-449(+)
MCNDCSGPSFRLRSIPRTTHADKPAGACCPWCCSGCFHMGDQDAASHCTCCCHYDAICSNCDGPWPWLKEDSFVYSWQKQSSGHFAGC